MAIRYSVRRRFSEIVDYLPTVSSQADAERNALGFLPAAAYEDAARQGKLLVLIAHEGNQNDYAGHLLFGGAFPNLRVRQICVAPHGRRHGNATKLLRTLKSIAETEGYLSIVANVASDLVSANAFYEKNGFTTRRVKAGGATRKRIINVRTLPLDTPNLIELMHDSEKASLNFSQPRKRSTEAPLYAIDLNVFFDAIRTRPRSENAHTLFKAALSHQIRIAVTDEFVQELKKRSHDRTRDPVLAFANGIPRLPAQDNSSIDGLFPIISRLVFADPKQIQDNDKSDILHLCHAVAAGAIGYITSDKTVLAARDRLMSQFGLDIIALSEFVELLNLPIATEPSVKGTTDFHIRTPNISETKTFFESEHVQPKFLEASLDRCTRICISDGDGIIGLAVLSPASALEKPSQLIVCVRQDHPYSSTVADFLIAEELRICTQRNACTVSLLDMPNHPITRRIAQSNGFQPAKGGNLSKIALGYAVTASSWDSVRLAIERLGGPQVQKTSPTYGRPYVKGKTSATQEAEYQLFDLESLLSPTLFVLPKRNAAVAPITAQFANALLGTEEQYSFLDVPEAQFLSRRTYYNTTRAANAMIRGGVVAFYESRRSRGRGAIVALARIIDVVTVEQNSVPELIQRAAVVENLKDITKSERVLATTFDNLLPLKRPVTLKELRKIGCAPKSNFVSATPISSEHLIAIVSAGFGDEA